MSASRPIIRTNRRVDLIAAAGQVDFTFPFPADDPADIAVFTKAGASSYFTRLSTGFTATLGLGNASVSVTFDVAPRPTVGDPVVTVRLEGRRVPERASDVTRGGVVRSVSMESELDRIVMTEQELRRDVDEFGPGVIDAAAAAQTAATSAQTAATAAAASAAQAATFDPLSYYSKTAIDAGFYTKTTSDGRFVAQTQIGTGANQLVQRGANARIPETRWRLVTNTTFYVRIDGSDLNDGMGNTAGGAFATLQAAYNYVARNVDLAGYIATIKLGQTGTYGAFYAGYSPPNNSNGTIVIQGDITTPANTRIFTSGSTGVAAGMGAKLRLEYINIEADGGVDCISSAYRGSLLDIGPGVKLKALNGRWGIANLGGCIRILSNITVDGTVGQSVWEGFLALFSGTIEMYNISVTAAAALTLGNAFMSATAGGLVWSSNCTFVGAALTGARYKVLTNAVINTNGAGANYFPGTVAGSVSTGGIYS